MKIIVCGAGGIGSNIAKQLVYEDNDVTIIDESESLLRLLNKSVDLAQNIFKSTTLKGSYSLAAVYKNDHNTIPNLPHHKDNNACTYTIDVCLFQEEPWSIWVESKEYFLKPNQAIIIYGEEEEHWREQFPNPETNIVGMLFNHYVEPDHWWNTGKRIDNSE